MTTSRHIDRWARHAEIAAVLEQILRGYDTRQLLADFNDRFTANPDEEARRRASHTLHQLEEELVKQTNCKRTAARKAVGTWVRRNRRKV